MRINSSRKINSFEKSININPKLFHNSLNISFKKNEIQKSPKPNLINISSKSILSIHQSKVLYPKRKLSSIDP